MAHTIEDEADDTTGLRSRGPDPCVDGADDLIPGQPSVGIERRGEPQLGVNDTVGRQVDNGLVAHSLQRIGCLGYRQGVGEGFEIALERS